MAVKNLITQEAAPRASSELVIISNLKQARSRLQIFGNIK
ncbi:uncharacterized protein G2W53_035885 [Senna tora]|uniref:Uncharacterized protein n=1 Tax=Senna tora TaxID=362788 RepID=A0A834SSK4_9FABA|nr:uncharacterized protein G2W53_035885 [Senna tora]